MPKKLLFFCSLLLFLSFIYFSYLVAKERFAQLDFDTTVRLQDHLPPKAVSPSLFLTLIGSIEFSTLVWIGLLIFCLLKRWWLTLVCLLLYPFGLLIAIYGKTFVHHPAPPPFLLKGVLSFDLPKYYIGEQYAYPSGHMFRTSFIATFLLGIAALRHSLRSGYLATLLMIVFLAIMAISRIFLGEHWLSDVVGGTLLGVSLGLFVWLTIPKSRQINHGS